jgi:hypothetical protein
MEPSKLHKSDVLKGKGWLAGVADGTRDQSEDSGFTVGRKRGRGKADADQGAGGRSTATSAESAGEVAQPSRRGKSGLASSPAAAFSHTGSPVGGAGGGRRGQRAPPDASGVDVYGYPIPSGDAKRRRVEKAALAVAATAASAVIAVGATAAPGPAEGEASKPP